MGMKKKKNSRGTVIGILAVIVCLLVGIIVLLMIQEKNNTTVARQTGAKNTGNTSDGSMDYSEITYNGEKYSYRKEIKTMLFLGIDKSQDDVDQDKVGTAGQSDCMILIVVNTNDNTAQMVAIPRETMVDVEVYNVDGFYGGTTNEQIALQYAYGENPKKGCWLTKKAVSRLMHDIPIDGYLSLRLDGISEITEKIGGVTLTVPQDYTEIDPSFAQGATVNLQGELAEKYVRKRDITVYASNEGRMERQNQFIRALVPQMKQKFSSDVQALLDILNDYITTDMEADEMKNLMSCSLTDETLTVPGQRISLGDDIPEQYLADDDALMQMIVDLCYDKE